MNTIKAFITENIGLKVLALFLAALTWFLVTNLDDPTVTRNFSNIPVTIKNAATITGEGKTFEVLDGTDVISNVRIVAPRSVADTFSRDNIVATADMNNLSSKNTLTINLTTNKYTNQVESIDGSINEVRLSIEDSKTKMLALSAYTKGVVEDGYIIGQISTDQNVLRISGPESAVNSVVSASVSVDVTGFTTDIETDAEIVLYDERGKEIKDSAIVKNIETVRVTISILQTKRVPVRAVITGTPAPGYLLNGEVGVNPDTLLIAGKGSNLNAVEEIVLAGSEFDVTDMTSDLEKSVSVKNMLPGGVTLGDSDFGGQVTVTAGIELAKVMEYDLPASNIRIENIPAGMRATLQTQDADGDGVGDGLVDVVVRGLEADVTDDNIRKITGVADLTELTDRIGADAVNEGAYTVSLSLQLPDGLYQAETTRVLIYLEREEKEE
ncbi:MAG: hypothetical protein K6C95_05155 [Lachnospiraceae bacterium]|nr:hypothetical protein [Lachnospiraceae bacterium]